jgi:hypothetical protein
MRRKIRELGLIIAGAPWFTAIIGLPEIELNELLWILDISLSGLIIGVYE